MKLLTPFITLQEQLRIFHWQTKSYAQHKAFGKAYDELGDLIDQFVEVFSGKNGVPVAKLKYNIVLENFTGDYDDFINDSIQFLNNLSLELNPEQDTDLLNIRDEMLGVLNKLKYLLRLS